MPAPHFAPLEIFASRLGRKVGAFFGYGIGGTIRKLCAAAIAAVIFVSPSQLAAQERVEIVALGDSLTQGYGLPPTQGFVPRLQAWLDARGANAVIVNAGVSGDTTAGGLARLDWSLSPTTDAMIVELGANDMLRGLPPEASASNLDRILAGAAKRGVPVLLAGITAPGNYGAAYKAAFDGMWKPLAERHGALLLPDFLGPLTALDPDRRIAEGLVQADRLHPSARGVEMVVEHVGPAVMELIGRVR